jgi:CRP/FNR family transcriptional regulator, cyclic AMP receptor protein
MHRRSVGSDGADRLAAIEFFAEVSQPHRLMLARLVDELDADPGDVLMDEGEFGYEAIFIEHGAAEVRREGELINTVGQGEVVGELALVDADGKRTATVVAASPLRALSLTSHAVRELASRMPEVGEAIERAAAAHRERDRRRHSAEQPG